MEKYPKDDQNGVEFPTIEQVERALLYAQTDCEVVEETDEEDEGDESPFWGDEEDDNTCIDVRLQVMDNGSWYLHTGDPQFDTDHRGYWGSGYLTADTDCRELAYELIEEARDQAAFETR